MKRFHTQFIVFVQLLIMFKAFFSHFETPQYKQTVNTSQAFNRGTRYNMIAAFE